MFVNGVTQRPAVPAYRWCDALTCRNSNVDIIEDKCINKEHAANHDRVCGTCVTSTEFDICTNLCVDRIVYLKTSRDAGGGAKIRLKETKKRLGSHGWFNRRIMDALTVHTTHNSTSSTQGAPQPLAKPGGDRVVFELPVA